LTPIPWLSFLAMFPLLPRSVLHLYSITKSSSSMTSEKDPTSLQLVCHQDVQFKIVITRLSLWCICPLASTNLSLVCSSFTRAQQLRRWATVWTPPQYTWAEKWGGLLCPFLFGELGPHLTMSPGSRPTSVPSGVLIRQPFGHNTPTLQTDSQIGHWDRTTVR